MADLSNLGLDYEAAKSSDLIPEGEYEASIVASELVATKDGRGQMLKLDVDLIVDGRKRRLIDRLNLVNPNADAQRIATKALLEYARACDVTPPVQRSEDLHHKPFMARVGIRAASGQYEAQSVISKRLPWSANGGARAPARDNPLDNAPAQKPAKPKPLASFKRDGEADDVPW